MSKEAKTETNKATPSEQKPKPSCTCSMKLTCIHSPLLKKTVEAEIKFWEKMMKKMEYAVQAKREKG